MTATIPAAVTARMAAMVAATNQAEMGSDIF